MVERVNADNVNVKKVLSVNVVNSKTVSRENVLMRKKRFVVELEKQLAQVKTIQLLDKNQKYFYNMFVSFLRVQTCILVSLRPGYYCQTHL